MIPTSIEILHQFENHEHAVCTSQNEQHIHQESLDCDEFHKQLTVFSIDFTSYNDGIPQHFYTTFFVDKPQVFKEIYQSIKTTRGPPIFTV